MHRVPEEYGWPGSEPKRVATGILAGPDATSVISTWNPTDAPALAQYVIYRSKDGGPFLPIGVQRPGVNRFCDYTGDPHMTASYRITARTSSLQESAPSASVTASTHSMTDDGLLTMVRRTSFRYCWKAEEPHSGLTR